MNKLNKYLGLSLIAGLTLVVTPSCSSSEDAASSNGIVTGTEALEILPGQARSLLTAVNGGAVSSAESFGVPNTRGSKYEVYTTAEGVALKIEFDANGLWTDIESKSEGKAIPIKVLSRLEVDANVLTYLQDTYGTIAIEEIERLAYGYEVSLLNGVELLFDRAGGFIGSSNDADSNANSNNGNTATLPTGSNDGALAFINTHFSGYTVQHVKTEIEDGQTEHKYYISSGLKGYKVVFDSAYNWKEVGGDDDRQVYLPSSVLALLPSGITNYLNANAGGRSVVSVEKKLQSYELELSDDTELYFNLDGALVYSKPGYNVNGNGSVNTGGSTNVSTEVNAKAQAFINEHFSGYRIQGVEAEVENGQLEYEYYISNGSKTYKVVFDSAYAWVEVEGDDDRQYYVPNSVLALLPSGITSYLNANARGRSVVSVQKSGQFYELELSDDTELYFTLEGRFLRIDY